MFWNKKKIITEEVVIKLDPDLQELAHDYQIKINLFEPAAFLFASIATVIIAVHLSDLPSDIEDRAIIGTSLGGIAGPIAALAGFFMLIATLVSQQKQMLYQEQATRMQNRQFTLQSFENSFFNLLNHYLSFARNYSIKVGQEKLTVQEYKTKLDYWKSYFKAYLEERNSSADIPKSELQEWLFDKFANQQNQVKNLFKPLISMLFFLDDAPIEEKEKYFKMLDYQVTEPEKFILFYFFITTSRYFTDEEKPIVSKFLKRIDKKTLIHPDHATWLDV